MIYACERCAKPFEAFPSLHQRYCGKACASSARAERIMSEFPARFWLSVRKGLPDECWPWIGKKRVREYGYTSFNHKTLRAHRVAYELTNGPIPEGMLVCHSCDNPACCNPAHLFLGTQLDNRRDAAAKNRTARGSKNGAVLHPDTRPRGSSSKLARLTEADVRLVRELVSNGATQKDVAARFDVHYSTISAIVRRATWRHVA